MEKKLKRVHDETGVMDSSDSEEPVKRSRSKYIFDTEKDVQKIREMDLDDSIKDEYIKLVRDDIFPDSVMDGVSENAMWTRKTRYRQKLYNLINKE